MAAIFDQQFIDMMVPHHEGAVAMARIAEARSQRPEIKQMAAEILRTQNAEIDLMKTWRRTWFGSDQTPPMSRMPMIAGSMVAPGDPAGAGGQHGMDHGAGSAGSTMDMAKDVEALRAAPEPFDLAFLEAMIPHHQSAVAAARLAESRAQRPEIKDLARAIIRDQEREIAQMQEWRRIWFGTAAHHG